LVTVSIGVAMLSSADTEQSLLKRADQALYRAKNDGRNRSVLDMD
jgi:diguanylate cyclase (GGDEF)-like protein